MTTRLKFALPLFGLLVGLFIAPIVSPAAAAKESFLPPNHDRFVDSEYDVVCYRNGLGLSCVAIDRDI